MQADRLGCLIIEVTHDLLARLHLLGHDLDEFSLDYRAHVPPRRQRRRVPAVTERARVALSRAAVAALVLASSLVVTWAFRPGYMNADSLIEYSVTQPGSDFTDQRAPLIEKLWDVFETAGVGSPTIVLFAQTLTMVAGFYLVFRAVLGRVPAALVGALLVFTPLVLSQVMLVGRDTWLTSFVVFQIGCVISWSVAAGRARRAVARTRRPQRPARRRHAPERGHVRVLRARGRGLPRLCRSSSERGRVRAVLVPLALGGASCVLVLRGRVHAPPPDGRA